jgi:hypothetical protein
LGHRVESKPGRACMAARLVMTVQSGERGLSGRAISPIGPPESNQALWPADLLVRAAGPVERGRPGRLTLQSPGRARQDGIGSANGSPRADLGHRVASKPGRACMAARLVMTVQSGERGLSGRAISPIGPRNINKMSAPSGWKGRKEDWTKS